MNTNPEISVILPVYNGETYLKAAIDSILNQTFKNFEFIIINDGSIDASEAIIKSYKDERIKYFYQDNLGLGATLNKGISLSRSSFIARQDQDDISLPDRFEKQINYLKQNPTVALIGTRGKIIDENNKHIGIHNHPTSYPEIKYHLIFDNPFIHSSVIFQKEIYVSCGGYDSNINKFEDYDLWSKIAIRKEIVNLENQLVLYRHHQQGLSKKINQFNAATLVKSGITNIENFLALKGANFIDLLEIYHGLETVNSITYRIINSKIKKITAALINLYPVSKHNINLVEKNFKAMLYYRLYLRKLAKSNNLMKLFIRIQYQFIKLISLK